MTKTRKRYSAAFKAKVALEALQGEQTIAELASKHGLHPNLITNWKRQVVEGLPGLFEGKPAEADKGREAEVRELHAKIGQLVVERDFLAKAFGR
jgi:transposase